MSNIIINWTPEKQTKVIDLIESYIRKYEVLSWESLMQKDEPYGAAPDLLGEIVEVLHPEVIDYE